MIILIAVGINSCQNSADKSALQDYANNVNSAISQSDATSTSLFAVLRSGVNASNAQAKQQQINETRQRAQNVLTRARGFNAPGSVKTANANLLQALRMRLDGITQIAKEIQPATGTAVQKDAITNIAAQMARFYASDVLYKDYTAPALVSALHAKSIAVGGVDGVAVNAGQFLPSIRWLDPSTVATAFGTSVSSGGSGGGAVKPGLHGDTLNSVSVGGTTLQQGATNTVTASPAPTFTLNFTNGGHFNESDVVCKVTVTGTGVTGTKTVPLITPGQSTSCAVALSKSPPAGTYSVVATVEKVPGEKNVSNNSQTFPVTFK